MGYISKYNGFIIPDKNTPVSVLGKTTSSSANGECIVLENPLTHKKIKTTTTIEEFINYTDGEYNEFVKYIKGIIDSFLIDQEKELERKLHRNN